MGFTYVRVNVAAPGSPDRGEEIELLVDTGAILSVIPRPVLERLGVTPIDTQRVRAFVGEVKERDVGVVLFTFNGASGGLSVIFGEEGDQLILGVTALEVMALPVDPRSGQLDRTDILMLSSFLSYPPPFDTLRVSGQGTPCTHNKLLLHWSGERSLMLPLMVSLSNHTSGGKVPLMSFDKAQDERDFKCDIAYADLRKEVLGIGLDCCRMKRRRGT
mgnify:CR=1 FL=1